MLWWTETALYDASVAGRMAELLRSHKLAVVVGCRVHEAAEAHRPGHVLREQDVHYRSGLPVTM